jgi:hypothetical protein
MPRSRSFTRLTMRVGLWHLGQSVDFVVSMIFLRSPVFAILAIGWVILLLGLSLHTSDATPPASKDRSPGTQLLRTASTARLGLFSHIKRNAKEVRLAERAGSLLPVYRKRAVVAHQITNTNLAVKAHRKSPIARACPIQVHSAHHVRRFAQRCIPILP